MESRTKSLQVTHVHGEHVSIGCRGIELLRYVYRPDPAAFECPKPYVHPLRTLGGSGVTGYRPSDHRWHKGLQMTASHLSGQNFWGGNSYVPGFGYQELPERVGSMRHDGFPVLVAEDDHVRLGEELTWITRGGEQWARERRGLLVHSIDADAGSWALDWTIDLTNLRDEPLRFGSPTTAGREMAGYTGLQWRGPRDFTGGTVIGSTDTGPPMGAQSAWLAFTARRDGVDADSTLVFAHAPENLDASTAINSSHWFVRSEPVPTVAFSWAFFEEFTLPPGTSFSYRYRVVVADGAWDRDGVAAHLKDLPW
ncbi:PmoA family protein [Streptomyces sp. NPDC048142]|uniref:DUF6807 domain-containing protein n=1 Tax=Streptomyces sp. NPDC048142 TaxID=3365501 RepID=UPI00371CD88C